MLGGWAAAPGEEANEHLMFYFSASFFGLFLIKLYQPPM
jgi:hypothetical protein